MALEVVEASLTTGERFLLVPTDAPFLVSKQTFSWIGVGLIAGVVNDNSVRVVCIWCERDGVYRNIVSFALADSENGPIAIGAILLSGQMPEQTEGDSRQRKSEVEFPDCLKN